MRRPRSRPGLLLALLSLVVATGASAPAAFAGNPSPSAAERQFAGLLNAARASQGLGRVEISPALTDIADDYVLQNEREGGITHSRDAPYTARANAVGCGKWTGPVLAVGYLPSARAVLDVWLGSPGHRAVILDPEITHLGTGLRGGHAVAFGMPCPRNAANTSGDFGGAAIPLPPRPPAPSRWSDPPVAPPPARPGAAPPKAHRLKLGRRKAWARGRTIRVRLRVKAGTARVRVIARRRGRLVRGRRITLKARKKPYLLSVRASRRGRWKVAVLYAGGKVSLGTVRVRSARA